MLAQLSRANDVADQRKISRSGIFIELVEAQVRVSSFRKWIISVVAGFLILFKVCEHVVL